MDLLGINHRKYLHYNVSYLLRFINFLVVIKILLIVN